MSNFDLVLNDAAATGVLALDIESSHPVAEYSADFWRPDWKLEGVGAFAGISAHYSRDPEEIKKFLLSIWDSDLLILGHNIKFDLCGLKKTFKLQNFPKNVICTMIAMNLVDENLHPSQLGLKPLAKKILKYDMIEHDEAVDAGRDSPLFAQYCMDDCRQVYRLWFEFLKDRLEKDDLMKLLKEIYMEMTKVVCDMELYGFGWNLNRAESLLINYKEIKDSREFEIRKVLGDKINLNSGDQLSKALFKDLKISTEGVEKTDSGKRFSVDAETLELIKDRHPIAHQLAEYRHALDMLGKYLMKITDYSLDDPHNRTHASTWLVSATGRTRQTNPPNQTIPKYPRFWIPKPESKDGKDFEPYRIRSGFKARDGYKLIVADFSQFQLRLCAHISGDEEMSRAYKVWQCNTCRSKGESTELLLVCPTCGAGRNEKILKDPLATGFWHGLDIHQMTFDACKEVMESRDEGKTANFALIFLATAARMHMEYPKFNMRQWQKIIDRFFEKYSGVRRYHEALENMMNTRGWVSDIFGRRRRISKRDIAVGYKHALNMFVNFPVQASEVHYAELCCASIRNKLIETNLWNNGLYTQERKVGIVHFMHDEIVTECPDEYVPTVSSLVENTMRYRVKLHVPIDAELKIKESW